MRVGVDMISAGGGLSPSEGGMPIYYDGLLRALSRSPRVQEIVAFVSPWNRGFAVPRDADIETVECRGLPRARGVRVLYEQGVLPSLLRRHGIDVLLSTCNTRPLWWDGASVVVLQSFQHLIFPHAYSPLRRAYLRTMVPPSLRGAGAVIVVSEWARREAVRLFGLDERSVFTVYHGVSTAVRAGAANAASTGAPYVVMVSTFYEYKNHRRLVEAFARVVHEHGLPHRLVLAGGERDVTRAELEEIAHAGAVHDRVDFLGPVEHDRVPELLAGADAVAYVSRYETFGHPVIEAFASGKPLVTSNVAAMAEIAGDAARLVDPDDVTSIASGLADVLRDEGLRARLAAAGPRRAAEFTWDRCADATCDALAYALERRRKAV